jgi:hypothetical protein
MVKRIALGLVVALGLLGGGGAVGVALVAQPTGSEVESGSGSQPRLPGERFARTELFFGSSRPEGEVTDAEFQQFLDGVVKPRFPDGLTLLAGVGQFRGADGIPVDERSRVLILLYPDDARGENSKRIEEIRAAYKSQFRQQSVLRSDRCCETVRF